MIKKTIILVFIFIACRVNLVAQNFYNKIVFLGNFDPTDTVYIFTKKETLLLVKPYNKYKFI